MSRTPPHTLPSSEAIHPLTRFCLPARQWTGGDGRYSPESSHEWNRVRLTRQDLDDPFFQLVRGVQRLYTEGKLDEAAFTELDLSFSVPCGPTGYDLIPSGRDIPVTLGNAADFFARVQEEHDRGTRRLLDAAQQQQQGSRDEMKNEKDTTRTGDVLTEQDLPFLGEFDSYAKSMLASMTERAVSGGGDDRAGRVNAVSNTGERERSTSHSCSNSSSGTGRHSDGEAALAELGMRWCIVVPNRNCSILLRPNGDDCAVTARDFQAYLASAVRAIEVIRGAILRHGRYPPPAMAQSSTSASTIGRRSSPLASSTELRRREEEETSALLRGTATPVRVAAANEEQSRLPLGSSPHSIAEAASSVEQVTT